MKDLKKIAIVTGANVGLGYNTALQLAGKGITVILACRNMEKAIEAKKKIVAEHKLATVEAMKIDTSSLLSVKAFAKAFIQQYNQLHILVNNAGIMMTPYFKTEEGFEGQLATNYLGHFALTGLLLPLLNNTPQSRVVTLSSLAHKWSGIQLDDPHFTIHYSPRKAYGQSKMACLMFAYELDRRLKKRGYSTLSVAAHPGLAHTNLAQHLPSFVKWLSPIVGQSAEAGALPTLYAALSPKIEGGEYIGPGGFMEWSGQPAMVSSNKYSKDKNIAKGLWKLSEELTKVYYNL